MGRPWTIKYYYTEDGKRPFKEWFDGLDDSVKRKVDAYINRMAAGNFTNCKPLRGVPDISELVMDFGPGYRVYYIRAGQVLLLTFNGGIKADQRANIKKAEQYRDDFRKRREAGTYDEPEFRKDRT